jgi:hypothetical protein
MNKPGSDAAEGPVEDPNGRLDRRLIVDPDGGQCKLHA